MKLRRLFLGAAIVALMAACGGKATETATETAVEATPEVEAVEETTEAPAEEAPVAAAPVKEEKKADPCEAKVKAFEKFVDELVLAQKNKANSAKDLKAFSEMLKQAPEQEAAVKECVENSDFKTRVQNAIMKCKQIRSQK
ncbi:MAG: hypothetical protein J6U84_00310 [Bacteroidales bacterium]|nr:hypothetical protein [Bacteroidales bacterium]